MYKVDCFHKSELFYTTTVNYLRYVSGVIPHRRQDTVESLIKRYREYYKDIVDEIKIKVYLVHKSGHCERVLTRITDANNIIFIWRGKQC